MLNWWRLYGAVFSLGVQSAFVYRWNFFTRAVFGLLPLAATIWVWQAIYSGPDATVGGYTFGQMVFYFVAVTVVESLVSPTDDEWKIASDIREGRISSYLLRPLNYLTYRASMFVSARVVYAAVSVLPLLAVIWWLPGEASAPREVAGWWVFGVSMVLAAALQFLIAFVLATLAFWVLEISTLVFILYSFEYFIDGGYAPEAVANYISLLGWSPKDNREFLSMAEIQELFALENINRRSAIFDLDKCFWLNGQHLLHMTLDRFADLSLPFLDKAGVPYGSREALAPVLAIVKPKVKHLSDVPDWIGYFFTEDYAYDPAAVEKALKKPGALNRLRQLREHYASTSEWTHPALEASLKQLAENLGVKNGEFIHPARVAVSGRAVGPGLYEMLEVLGKDRVLARLDATVAKFS